MTMRKNIYLLLTVLVLVVLQATAVEFYPGKGSSALDRREKVKNEDFDGDADDRNSYKDRTEDEYTGSSSSRRNRYQGYGSPSNSYRSRSRTPSSYDDSHDSEDWSHTGGIGLNELLASLPGFSSPPMFDDGPTCHSILDPQFALFSDVCGVMPQARYSLPNLFGHVERWQIAQTLTALLDPATTAAGGPSCGRSLRLLICPLLFPPCESRRDTVSMLPCQPFCRAVKNQCPSPSLELLPCDFLPPMSDVCPITQSPFASFMSQFGPSFPVNGGFSQGGLPPSALSSLLAQSALSSAFSPGGFPPSGFPSSGFQSAGFPQPSFSPAGFGSNGFSSGGFPSAGGFPSSGGFPLSGGFPSSGFQSLGLPNALSSQFSQMSPFQSLSGHGASRSPQNHFNSAQYSSDSLAPVLVDFPPLPKGNDGRQAGRGFPSSRSTMERV